MGKKRRKQIKPDPWKAQAETIRRYLERAPQYEKLCAEVAFALEHSLRAASIEFSSVTSRAKTLSSFLEKIERKAYADPLEEIEDLAGIRVVHLYRSDFKLIEEIIEDSFDVIERVDKLEDFGTDRFGYGATHFILRIGDSFTGARYDDLKSIKCEVQVRTALQDAWAIISHHLVYKRESSIPQPLRRKVNSLAGLLETADDQFEHIRTQRNKYVARLQKELSETENTSSQTVDADSLSVYLAAKFPDMPLTNYGDQPKVVLEDFNYEKYSTLAELDSLFERTSDAREAYYELTGSPNSAFTGLAVALGLDSAEYRSRGWDVEDMIHLAECSKLVRESDSK